MRQRQFKVNQRKSKRKINNKNIVNIDLDTKCSCLQSNDDATIQFAHRYLQCESSMPIRVIRLFIESILPYSSMINIFIYDSNDRLLKDSDRLRSLKHTSSSSDHIPLRFTLINTITSLPHCSCLSPLDNHEYSSSPAMIQQETIEQILSTCSLPPQIPLPTPPNVCDSLIEIDNILTPQSVTMDSELDQSTIDYITSEFGEIYQHKRYRRPKRFAQENALEIPLDLSMKNHSLPSQTKWIEK